MQLIEDIKHQNFKNLDMMHHLSSGFKSVHTQDITESLYVCRQSIGGAGFSAWSGIPAIIELFSPTVTYEGDNTVMAQQSANFLLKHARQAMDNQVYKTIKTDSVPPVHAPVTKQTFKKLDGPFEYFYEIKELLGKKCPIIKT